MGGERVGAWHVHFYHWKSRLFCWWRASEPLRLRLLQRQLLPPPSIARTTFLRPAEPTPVGIRLWECQEQSRNEVGGIHKNKDRSSVARRVGKPLEVVGNSSAVDRPSRCLNIRVPRVATSINYLLCRMA
jgi:hypothetical protein